MLRFKSLREDPSALPTIVAWIDAEWGEFSGRTLSETRERYRSEFDTPKNVLPFSVVAYDHTQAPVGVISLRDKDSTDWDPSVRPWICAVFVPEAARGKGVAGALCLEMEDRAKLLGFRTIYLANAVGAGSLYDRIGYQTYRDVDHKHGRQFLMRKTIGQA